MSAMPQERDREAGQVEAVDGVAEESVGPSPLTIRRSLAWAVLVAVGALAVAGAYLSRVASTGSTLDWLFLVVTSAVATASLLGALDARRPLLVADELGVRLRLGGEWRGLPWEAVQQVVVEPPANLVRDGRLVVVPRSLARVVEGLDKRGRRQATSNQRRYGAALAIPLGLVTRGPSTRDRDVADRLVALAAGRTDLVTVTAEPAARPFRLASRSLPAWVTKRRVAEPDGPPQGEVPLPAPAVPLRETRPSVRADVVASSAVPVSAEHDPVSARWLPEERRLWRPGAVELEFEAVPSSKVRPIARLGEPVEPLVIDDFETQPAYDPVIGPELVAARHRLGLSVDELGERTRIRPHVIESIEVDDFEPCGGDVYARGHLRTLARVLGQDPAPLLEGFDNRYASAPVSARRVFEAELATGMTGSMRSTVGGPNWGLLVGVVLSLVLVWGVVRLLAGEPNDMVENPPPVPGAKAWPPRVYDEPKTAATATRTVPLKLVAVNGSSRVQVRDRAGNVVFDRQLVFGETTSLRVPTRVTVSAEEGGAVAVTWDGHDKGLLGEAQRPAEEEFGSSAD